MNTITHDRDLLRLEPVLFLGGGCASRTLIAGGDGVLSGSTFTSPGSDFALAALAAGMVLCTWTDAPEEPTAVEIVSVDSATQLTVSVLRESPDSDPVAPSAGSGLGFFVRSYRPEIRQAADQLAHMLSRSGETHRQDPPTFCDAAVLRETIAIGALATIFSARSGNGGQTDSAGIKAERYRREWLTARTRLRVAVDTDGDGLPDETRTLGHVTLRRI